MDGVLEYSFGHPKYHLIYNHKSRNKFGSHRAYRIQNDAMSKFMLHNSNFGRAAGWARYQMAVTKYQDMEDVSSSIYAQNDPFDPVLDFHRFLENNDDLVDEDLVLWLTTGSYHIPHSEDTPSVSTSANQYTVVFSPYNFFPTCPTVSFSETLHIKRNKNSDSLDVQTFGTEVESKCFQKETTYEEFNGSTPPV
ncbi:hypothetical protein LOTGIDRAFT_231727 [Lottia gigantea]|uniref:Amine oxidase n=1 Tax=Lottia gigantea TaxID=225164 RepID=V4AIU0_LOTGI|nr:hypothetical protein LOTGIDRAFT_231727 [Lottia gigantea]ESO96937.1 hypothetical protein LOTGIDRAFT_231727 [Lottia gigantea]